MRHTSPPPTRPGGIRASPGASRTAAGLLVGALLACGPRERQGEGTASAHAADTTAADTAAAATEAPPSPAADSAYAVQLAALADSAAAAAMRDSLAREGWPVRVERAVVGAGARWRVQVLPTASEPLARHAMAALRAERKAPLLARVPPEAARAGGAALWPVNRGTHGMAARTRWARSADGARIVVVEDPAAVEAEPVPNGVVVASERTGALLQLDGVWDATPSPDWSRLAVAWAFVLQGREEMTIPEPRWRAFARELPPALARAIAPGGGEREIAARLRASAFAVSGMAVAEGVGLVQTLRLDSLAAGAHRLRRADPPAAPVLRLDGWRVRWTPDGRLVIGAGLQGSQDHRPPARWVLTSLSGDSVAAVRDTAGLARLAWVEGPTLDYGAVHDLPAPGTLDAGARRIESRGGWIRVREGGAARIVGPGQALAATATGRFVVALAPSVASGESQPLQLVVYHLP